LRISVFRPTPLYSPFPIQVRALFGYGSLNRKGFKPPPASATTSRMASLQNQIAQINYNGGCCGIALEYRPHQPRPGPHGNQFRVAFIIANLGTFGKCTPSGKNILTARPHSQRLACVNFLLHDED